MPLAEMHFDLQGDSHDGNISNFHRHCHVTMDFFEKVTIEMSLAEMHFDLQGGEDP